MVLLLNVLLLSLFSGGLYWHWRRSPAIAFYWPGLLLKLLCGCAVVFLYQNVIGSGDILWVHRGATALAKLFFDNKDEYFYRLASMGIFTGPTPFMGPERTSFYIKILSPLYILCGSNIWLSSLWLSFLGFISAFWLVHRLSLHFIGSSLAAALAFLFWPSIAFWTSGLLKESPSMAATAILVAGVLPLLTAKGRNTLLQWGLMLLAAWFLWRLKYYFAIPLFGILLFLWMLQYLKRSTLSANRVLVLLGIGVLMIIVLLSQLHPNLRSVDRILYVLVYNYHALAALSEQNHYLSFEGIEASLWSVLLYCPKALAGGLLMPLPFIPFQLEIVYLLAGLENLLLLLLIVAAFYKLYKNPPSSISLLAAGLSLYVVLLAIAMAISAPNFGTLLRYRTAYLPFATFLLLYWLFPFGWRRKGNT